MRTRNPKCVDEAKAEVQKAMDEMNNAQSRIRKAAKFLLHEGNTPSASSAHYHYAVAMRLVHPHFTSMREVMWAALDAYNEEQAS
jgi:hypothetical protein